ncbi:PREDICTED: uncharacterized protein LOC109216514 [Nicotiana attenuata]|uniref:uncharacterized protein LOC109216514 n=1 Tax=Nicotiana attenuata TaxID=49451 RepID=UPI00090583FD|nr:PREDICTED: uncharacterized protein LOC109216514 [Nicotiana attenuata]
MNTCHDEGIREVEDPFSSYFAEVEDVGLCDLDVPRKSSIEASSSFKLTNQFPAPSVDHGRKRPLTILVPEDARLFSAPMGWLAISDAWSLKRTKPRWMKWKLLACSTRPQHALNRASLLNHEAFLRIREERKAEVQGLTEKCDTYKLLSEKLQVDLVTARDEHVGMAEQVLRVLHDSEDELEITTNDLILQVRQRLEQIKDLQRQIDKVRGEAEEFKECMDILAAQKEVVQVDLDSAESQLRSARDNSTVQANKIEELESNLANLAKELEVARSKAVVANIKAQASATQYKADAEATLAQAKSMVDHAKCFDISAEIEIAWAEETKARGLAFPEEDSENLSESGGGKDSEGKTTSTDKECAV